MAFGQKSLGMIAADKRDGRRGMYGGGLAENASEMRAEACEYLGWFGVSIDADANRAVGPADVDISRDGAKVRTLVIHAREELVVARGCRTALGS